MGYIGNIVTERRYKFDPIFKKCNGMEEIDPSIPTLIFGWTDNVKKNYPNQCILDKKINDMLFWSYSRLEKRDGYEQDVNLFYKYCVDKIKNELNYNFINLYRLSKEQICHTYRFMLSNDTVYKTIYVDNDNSLFIFYERDEDKKKEVIGISLAELEYLGIKKDKVMSKLRTNNSNFVFDNVTFLSPLIRKLIGDEKPMIPYLSSILRKN